MLHFLALLAISLLVIESFMLFLWILYILQRNVSLVDIGWGICFIIAALVDFSLGDGFFWRRFFMLALASVWAGRLVYHLIQRYHPAQDDPRYAKVLKSPYFKGPDSIKVLSLYLIQGLLAAIISIPFAIMAENDFPYFYTLEMFGLIVWMIGLAGEGIADYQLARFRAHPENRGRVLQTGFWKYSRHPNYFFEWVVWIGFAILALGSPWGFLALVSPVIIIYLLLKVSGVTITEEQLVSTKGVAYEEYQSKTSTFLPWFPR